MIGDSSWRTVDDSMSVTVARKYAAGGITDGTEVSWNKKKQLPPELAAALGQVGVSTSDDKSSSGVPQDESKTIDLLRNPAIRRSTIDNGDKIHDGVTMQWSKNSEYFIFFTSLGILLSYI